MINSSTLSLDLVSTINKHRGFLVVAIIYFFLNNFLLPHGLLYTILLTPVFLVWLNKHMSVTSIILPYLIVSLPLFFIHYSYGINILDYIKSSILYLSCIFFTAVIYIYFKYYSHTFEKILEEVLKINVALVVIAILSLLIWSDNNIFWYQNEITELLGGYERLKLLTYEASYYSLLLVPAFFFYFQYLFHSNFDGRKKLFFISIIVSLLLSLSYGALGIISVTILAFILINGFLFLRSNDNIKFLSYAVPIFLVATIAILVFFGDTGFFERIDNILQGRDTSVKGRVFDSYVLADKVIQLKSEVFGVGPGQFDRVGSDIVNNFYYYMPDPVTGEFAPVRIPCAMAETLAVFGYTGVVVRLLAQVFLFVKTRVLYSSFRLCLFIFMFFYQFMGSNFGLLPEYFIWALAFCNVFPDSYFKKQLPVQKKW